MRCPKCGKLLKKSFIFYIDLILIMFGRKKNCPCNDCQNFEVAKKRFPIADFFCKRLSKYLERSQNSFHFIEVNTTKQGWRTIEACSFQKPWENTPWDSNYKTDDQKEAFIFLF